MRSYLDLPHGFELDVQFRALAAIELQPASPSGEGVGSYQELDARLGWRLGRSLLSLDGRNLLHDHHVEMGVPGQGSALRRSVYGKVAWEL